MSVVEKMEVEKLEVEKIEILVNTRYFIIATCELLNLILKKTKELNINNKEHRKLQVYCDELLDGIKDSSFDITKLIKKVYKSVGKCVHKITQTPEDPSIFKEKNAEGKIITMLPGINIGIIIPELNEEELKKMWGLFFVMYISSVRMVTITNKLKKEGKIWEAIKILQDKVNKLDITIGNEKVLFAPYVGVTGSNELDISSMFSNVEELKSKTPSEIVGSALQKMGLPIEGDVNFDKISEELKNIDDKKLDEAKKSVHELLGMNQKTESREIFDTLIESVAKEIKLNGLGDMKGGRGIFDLAHRMSEKIGNEIGDEKMQRAGLDMLASFQNIDKHLDKVDPKMKQAMGFLSEQMKTIKDQVDKEMNKEKKE
jgi:hypothetical protein